MFSDLAHTHIYIYIYIYRYDDNTNCFLGLLNLKEIYLQESNICEILSATYVQSSANHFGAQII